MRRNLTPRSDTMRIWQAGAIAAPRTIGWIEAGLMRQFGHTYEQARAIAQAKRVRAGKVRGSKYVRHRAPKGGTLR